MRLLKWHSWLLETEKNRGIITGRSRSRKQSKRLGKIFMRVHIFIYTHTHTESLLLWDYE